MHRSFRLFTDLRRRFTWVRRPFRTLRPCPRHRTDPLSWLVGSSRITEPFRFHSIRRWWPLDPRVPLDALCLAECAEAFLYLLHRLEVPSGPLRWWNSTLRIDPRHPRIESAAAEIFFFFFFKQKSYQKFSRNYCFPFAHFYKNIQISFFSSVWWFRMFCSTCVHFSFFVSGVWYQVTAVILLLSSPGMKQVANEGKWKENKIGRRWMTFNRFRVMIWRWIISKIFFLNSKKLFFFGKNLRCSRLALKKKHFSIGISFAKFIGAKNEMVNVCQFLWKNIIRLQLPHSLY